MAENAAWLRLERGEKVPEIVARQILNEIVRRRLVTGDMLPPEAAMVEQFGVGRASLREALRILEIHGLIRIKAGPRGGPVVVDANPTEFGRMASLFLFRSGATYRELLEARLVIEPLMVRLGAERLTPEGETALKEAVELAKNSVDSDSETWAETTERFHAVVAGLSGNGVLDLYAAALIGIERRRIGPVFRAGDREPTIAAHVRIADAIISRDGPRAERLTRRHIEEVRRHMEVAYPEQLGKRVEWS